MNQVSGEVCSGIKSWEAFAQESCPGKCLFGNLFIPFRKECGTADHFWFCVLIIGVNFFFGIF